MKNVKWVDVLTSVFALVAGISNMFQDQPSVAGMILYMALFLNSQACIRADRARYEYNGELD